MRPAVLVPALVLLAVSCRDEATRAPELAAVAVPTGAGVAAVRTSELHAGPMVPELPEVRNPYEGDARAIQQGRRYYNWFNCTGCHGERGGGGMGPPLADAEWIYGGHPAQIFESIVKGRPAGMPAFSGQIPEDRLWMIVAYVQTLPERAGEPRSRRDSRQREATRDE